MSGGPSRWRIDISPLRSSPAFRLVFASGLVTYLGSMMTYVAIPFQVAELTDSYVAVGLIGLAELLPLVVFGLYGGALADRVDRRLMVVGTEIASTVLIAVLLVNSLLPQPQLWVLYTVAMLIAAVDGLQRPSLDAIVPRVVAHDQLAAAAALGSIKWNLGTIVGPAIGGLLLAAGGAAAVYAIDVATFCVSIVLLLRLPGIRAAAGGDLAPGLRDGLRHIGEGLRYAVSRKDLLGTYAVDLVAMIFAFPYALFPFFAQQLGAPWALGLLYAAGSVGALAVSLTSGWTSRIHRHGRAIIIAAGCWGLAIAFAGIAPTLWSVLVFLAIAGASDMVSGIFRGLIWNQTIPDSIRGRMAGIELLSFSVGPLLGQIRSSTAASLTSLRASIASGGVLCVVGVAAAAVALPALWRYDSRTDPNAVAQREIQGSPGGFESGSSS